MAKEKFPRAEYREQIAKLTKEELIEALTREAELRFYTEREDLDLKKV